MTIAMEDIKGRLLLELYTHWCQGRFGSYMNPTPTYLGAFGNALQSILADVPSTDPVHQAWEQYLLGVNQPPDLVAPLPPQPNAPEAIPFEPEPGEPSKPRNPKRPV